MRIFLLIGVVMLFAVSSGYSQPPGYEGKRALLDLATDVSPAIRIASRRDIPPYLFNFIPSGEIEYTLSRKLSTGAQVNPILAGVIYERNTGMGKAQIHGMGISLSARIYSFKRKGNIAPLGPYKKVELMYVTYWLIDEDELFYNDSRTWLGRYDDLGIGLTLGERRMLGDGISFNYGIRFATILGILDGSRNPDRMYIKDIATDRLQGYFFLNFHVGLGLLIF